MEKWALLSVWHKKVQEGMEEAKRTVFFGAVPGTTTQTIVVRQTGTTTTPTTGTTTTGSES